MKYLSLRNRKPIVPESEPSTNTLSTPSMAQNSIPLERDMDEEEPVERVRVRENWREDHEEEKGYGRDSSPLRISQPSNPPRERSHDSFASRGHSRDRHSANELRHIDERADKSTLESLNHQRQTSHPVSFNNIHHQPANIIETERAQHHSRTRQESHGLTPQKSSSSPYKRQGHYACQTHQTHQSKQSSYRRSANEIDDYDKFKFDFDEEDQFSYVETTEPSEFNTERRSRRSLPRVEEDRPCKVGADGELIPERGAFYASRDLHNQTNMNRRRSSTGSDLAIEYEQRLKDSRRWEQGVFKKSEYISDDIGGAVIIEQDVETSRESPKFSVTQSRDFGQAAQESMKTHITKDSSGCQLARAEARMTSTTDPKEHSLRNGIQIFNMNMDSEEKTLHGSIDTRHHRISSVPKSILQKRQQSRDLDPSPSTSTQMISAKEELQKASSDVSPGGRSGVHREDSTSNRKSVTSHMKSDNRSQKSVIDDLAPEEKYRHGELIGSNLQVICVIRKINDRKLTRQSHHCNLSPDLKNGSGCNMPLSCTNQRESKELQFSSKRVQSPYNQLPKQNVSYDAHINSRERSNSKQKAVEQKQKKTKHTNHCNLLATQEPSRFVFRCPPGLQSHLLRILLKNEQEVQNCSVAFEAFNEQTFNQTMKRKSLKVFEFDNCIAETNGQSLAIGMKQPVDWLVKQTSEQPEGCNNVVFLFGQSEAKKNELLSYVDPHSMFNLLLKHVDTKFMRCSMFYMGQEYLLAHRQFGTRHQMKLELGTEVREAFRQRDLNAKKIALKLSTVTKQVKAEEVKQASHFVLQIDKIVIVDLADIDNLKDPQLAKKISNDFSAVTNAILSMSPFYKDHQFDQTTGCKAGQGEPSNLRSGTTSFNLLVKNFLSLESRILMVCCVVENSIAGSQAVEYCHKIKSYFKGNTNDDETTEFSNTAFDITSQSIEPNMDTVKAFKQLSGLFSEVEKTKAFIDRIFDAKRSGREGPNRTNAQMKNLVETLRDDVSELLGLIGERNEEYKPQLGRIKDLLQIEINQMHDKVCAIRSLSRSTHSNKKSVPKVATIPRALSHQSSVEVNLTPMTKNGQSFINLARPLSQQTVKQRNQKEQIFLIKKKPNSATRPGENRADAACYTPQAGKNASSRNRQVNNRNRIDQRQTNTATGQTQANTSFTNASTKPFQTNDIPTKTAPANRSTKQITKNNSNRSIPGQAKKATPRSQNTSISSNGTKNRTGKSKKNLHSSQDNYDLQNLINNIPNKINDRRNTPAFLSSNESLNQLRSEVQTLFLPDENNHSHQSLQHHSGLPPRQSHDSLPQSQHHTFRPNAISQYDFEMLAQQVYTLKTRLQETEQMNAEHVNRAVVLQQTLDAKEKEVDNLMKHVSDLEYRLGIKDKIINSLESQLKSANRDRATSVEKKEERKYAELLEQKKKTDQINSEVITQIGMLKDAIQTFQQQEEFNRKLIENQKRKDMEMKELRKQVQILIEAQRGNESTTSLLKHFDEEPTRLNRSREETDQKRATPPLIYYDNAYPGSTFKNSGRSSRLIAHRDSNHQGSDSLRITRTSKTVQKESIERERSKTKSSGKKDCRDQTEKNTISPIKPTQVQQLQEQIRQLERAKDTYKDETAELKHQLKKFRQINHNMQSLGSEQYSIDEKIPVSNNFGNLKNMIQSYKNEKNSAKNRTGNRDTNHQY